MSNDQDSVAGSADGFSLPQGSRKARNYAIRNPSRKEVCQYFESAVETFLRDELVLLEEDIHEQTITGHLATHLRPHVGHEWNIDCEYNRDCGRKKRVGDELVKPDIIVHIRNTERNLLVIEGKKAAQFQETDLEKLKKFKSEKHYSFAVLVCFPVGRGLGSYNPSIFWV